MRGNPGGGFHPILSLSSDSGPATKERLTRFLVVPMFYFDLHNDMDVPDNEGADLPDLEAAIGRASCQARALVCEMAKEMGRIDLRHRIDIEDGGGVVLETVRYGDVVEVRP